MIPSQVELSSTHLVGHAVAAAPYQLIGCGWAGRADGLLLRFAFPGVGSGYSTLQPWVSRGDLPLVQQVEALRAGRLSTPLLLRAYRTAFIDAKARAEGVPLLGEAGSPLVVSNATIVELDEESVAAVGRMVGEGFSHIKVKVRGFSGGSWRHLAHIVALLQPVGGRLRVDVAGGAFVGQLLQLQELCGETLQYVEDPFAAPPCRWKEKRAAGALPLFAADAEVIAAAGDEGVSYLVVKPAVVDVGEVVERATAWQKIVVTSYLDHPLGQLAAAEAALRIPESLRGVCGLSTHRVWQETPYSRQLRSHGPLLCSVGGSGLGFDDLLEAEPWRRMI